MSVQCPSADIGRARPTTLAEHTCPDYRRVSPSTHRVQSRKRQDRDSFSSVKEDDSGIPQSFLVSKESTLFPLPLRDQDRDSDEMAETLTMQNPPGFCCPCGGSRGWKEVQLGKRGHHKSKSYSDLRLFGAELQKGWDWARADSPERLAVAAARKPKTYPAGQSLLEKLPTEILDQILPLLVIDLPPNDYTPRNTDLISCLLSSRTLYVATLGTLYKQITLPHSYIFSKFLNHISAYQSLGTLVRRLDFSHFSSVGLGRSRRDNLEIQNVTSATLLKCLNLTPQLHEFLIQEHLDEDIDEKVVQKLFCGMEYLRAMDFCAASSAAFKTAFTNVINFENTALPVFLDIQRLSLHECNTLPSSVFEILLPKLHRLTHLDVAHTRITDEALFSIPETARLTHLNLSKCSRLSGEKVVNFLTTHPAVRDSLVYLNLYADIAHNRLLEESDVENLLPKLPSSLKALHLTGAKIKGIHVPLLLPLTKHVEELSLGSAQLSVQDINDLFVPRQPEDEDGDLSMEEQTWVPPAMHYLDLTGVPSITAGAILSTNSVLTRPMTAPLEVLELGDSVITCLKERPVPSKRLGWVVRECGRRGWYVREPRKDIPIGERDNGKRAWKMGAMWWGGRKVPVAWGEVGGLYGHYMFKK